MRRCKDGRARRTLKPSPRSRTDGMIMCSIGDSGASIEIFIGTSLWQCISGCLDQRLFGTGHRRFACRRTKSELLGAHEGDMGQTDETEQRLQVRFLEVHRVRRTFVIVTAARYDDDDPLAGDEPLRSRLRL